MVAGPLEWRINMQLLRGDTLGGKGHDNERVKSGRSAELFSVYLPVCLSRHRMHANDFLGSLTVG